MVPLKTSEEPKANVEKKRVNNSVNKMMMVMITMLTMMVMITMLMMMVMITMLMVRKKRKMIS